MRRRQSLCRLPERVDIVIQLVCCPHGTLHTADGKSNDKIEKKKFMSYCYTIRKREKSERYCGPTSWSRSLQERYSLLVSDAKESRGWYLKDHGANPMAKNLSQNKAKKMISTPTNSIPRFRARNHVGIYLLAKEQRPDFPFTTRSPFWGIIEAGRTKRNT